EADAALASWKRQGLRHNCFAGRYQRDRERKDEELQRRCRKLQEHVLLTLNVTGDYFTNTQVGLSKGKAMIPTAAVAAIKSGLLIFHRKRTTTLIRATIAVSQSPIAIRPSRTDAPRIVPIAAAYAPLTKPLTSGCARWRTRIGATISTNRNDGRN